MNENQQYYRCVNCYDDVPDEDYDHNYNLCKHCSFLQLNEDRQSLNVFGDNLYD